MLTPGIVASMCVGQSKQSNGLLPTISPPLGASVIIDSLSISPYLKLQLGSERARERERQRDRETEDRESSISSNSCSSSSRSSSKEYKDAVWRKWYNSSTQNVSKPSVAFLNFDMDLALRVCQVSHKPTECTHVWFAGTCSSLVTLYENPSMVAATD